MFSKKSIVHLRLCKNYKLHSWISHIVKKQWFFFFTDFRIATLANWRQIRSNWSTPKTVFSYLAVDNHKNKQNWLLQFQQTVHAVPLGIVVFSALVEINWWLKKIKFSKHSVMKKILHVSNKVSRNLTTFFSPQYVLKNQQPARHIRYFAIFIH